MMASQVEQRSDAWFALRCGRVTASRVADVVARTKTGWGASRENYKSQLVCERLTGFVEPSYTNTAMQWGIDTEAEARQAYSFRQDVDVAEIGFVQHPTIVMSGCSPDGLVGDDGMVEIKCPNSATHITTLLGGKTPEKYVTQVMWQLACTGRQWADFASYDPRLPESMRLFVQRVHRDAAEITRLEDAVIEFLAEVDETVKALERIYGPARLAA